MKAVVVPGVPKSAHLEPRRSLEREAEAILGVVALVLEQELCARRGVARPRRGRQVGGEGRGVAGVPLPSSSCRRRRRSLAGRRSPTVDVQSSSHDVGRSKSRRRRRRGRAGRRWRTRRSCRRRRPRRRRPCPADRGSRPPGSRRTRRRCPRRRCPPARRSRRSGSRRCRRSPRRRRCRRAAAPTRIRVRSPATTGGPERRHAARRC